MEVFAYLVIFGIVVACCIVFAVITGVMTRNRGRGAIIVFAFFAPALFVAYLILAASLRNSYHGSRGEAFDDGGNKTVPLSHGYEFSFFYKSPWMALIYNEKQHISLRPPLDNVQQVALAGDWVFGGIGKSNMLDSRVDFYFSLNLATAEVRRFGSEADLRSHSPSFGVLSGPEELYNSELDRERSALFWPLLAGAPITIFAGLIWLRRKWNPSSF